MSQPRRGQQPDLNNLQPWQQLLMCQLIQEPQSQNKFKQLDPGTGQRNSLSKLSASAKPAPVDQLPAMIDDVPINHVSDCNWPKTVVPSMPLVPINSQPFIGDNMNWLQLNDNPTVPNVASSFVISNNQIQTMRSMGFIPQQFDQTFHGIPVSSAKGVICQHPQFFGASSNCTDLTTTGARNESRKAWVPFNSLQSDQSSPAQNFSRERTFAMCNFHGKGSLDNASVQVLSNDVTSGNFQQIDNLKCSVRVHEVQDNQDKADLSSNLHENPSMQVETSDDVAANLDPTEQKLLFGMDDGHSLEVPLGGSLNTCSGNFLCGSSLENIHFGAIPSMQSGSWSALMQEAVQACSSDKGIQEEWSGLSYQKMECPMVMDSVVSNDNAKQPTTWDDSYLQSASSLTSRHLPLYNDADACSNSCTSPSFHNSFAHDGNSRVQSGAPHVSFQLSAGGNNYKQFHQDQKQKPIFEGGPQAQIPLTNEVWVDQSYEQCANDSVDMQYTEGSWTYQQNEALVNFPGEFSDTPNFWNSSYIMAPGGDCVSDVCDNDVNMGKPGGSNMHVNSGEQPVESDIGSSVQAEDFAVDNYGSVVNTNNFEWNDEMNQLASNSGLMVFGKNLNFDACVTVKTNGDKNVERNYNQLSGRPQTSYDTNKRLSSTDENKKDLQMVSGDGYTSSSLDHSRYSYTIDSAKENSVLAANDQKSFVSEIQDSLIQTGQHTVGSKMKRLTGSLGMDVEPLLPKNHPFIFQCMPKSVIQGYKKEEQIYAQKSKFADHIDSNNVENLVKRIAVESQKLQSRDNILTHASASSFDGSIGPYSQNKRIAQTSQNVLELLHKVDQSRNTDIPAQVGFDTASPRICQPSAVQGFGLQLAPPSQQFSKFVLPSNTCLNINPMNLDSKAGDKDQIWSISTPSVQSLMNETSQRENQSKISSISEQKHKEALYCDKQNTLSAIARNSCNMRNHLQGQQSQERNPNVNVYLEKEQDIPSSTGYGTLDQSMNFTIFNQANANALVKNTSLLQQPYKSHDGAVADRSIQTSFPSLAGRVPPFRVASGEQLQTTKMDYTKQKQVVQDFSQISSSMYSNTETISIQPSTAGISYQVDPSSMLAYMWTNISTQQHQASLLPDSLSLQIPQSHNIRETSFLGLQKTYDQGSNGESASSEVGTSSHLMNRDDPNKRFSLKPSITEKIDSITQAETEFQWTELVGNAEEGLNTFIPSLVHLHQKGMDQGKSWHASTPYTQAVHASINRMASSSSEIGFPGFTSNPSDVQQKNCSLLHRMQARRKADSDLSNKVQSRLRGADFVSNSSFVYWNNDQGNVQEQDSDFKIPAYRELGACSQSLLPSNAKMLSFASKENVLQNASTPSSGGHCLQNDISSLSTCSTANLIRGNEHTCMNPQVSPSWFEKYQMYKNDAVIAEHDGQKITKPTSQQNFFSDIPGSTAENIMVKHRIQNSQTYTWPSSSIAEVSSDRPHSLLPTIVDQDAVIRSRKRKNTITELLPWHKVAQGQQRLRSISIAELDWARVTNKLFEKVHDGAEALENGPSTTQPRRRLILTTHLMHQLIPAVPSRILNKEVISAYENVTFSIAKSALADVCSLISSLGRDYHIHLEKENTFSDNVTSCKKAGDHLCSKIMEVFIQRSKKLECDFSRLDKRSSVLNVRKEFHELERFSLVNRLGEFHGRPPIIEDSSSTSEAPPRKTFRQNYITAYPVPGNLPEGVPCLSL
ncbi:uncharacterized protein LOC135617968 isoform X1 [Musa acuminata AAA Group]|uniref:uncharacterized protein LOC135617968 isoform X1 n=1 Tax=Musa acuminata AAA Group TaxID=214697 RepID=UPI0031D0569E